MLSIAGLFVGSASSLPAKRQIISSVHGTLAAPNADAVIAPQETFPFSFETANLCESGYSPLSVWLLQQPPSDVSLTSSGEYAEGDYLYQFGDFLVANFGNSIAAFTLHHGLNFRLGLPQMNTPPPSTLVMPNTSDLAQVPMVAEDGTTTVYFTVVETYSDCPVCQHLTLSIPGTHL